VGAARTWIWAASTSLPAAKAPEVKAIATLDSLAGDSTVGGGNVVYVDFRNSWSVPYRRSFPYGFIEAV
jgi:hypothetical protein